MRRESAWCPVVSNAGASPWTEMTAHRTTFATGAPFGLQAGGGPLQVLEMTMLLEPVAHPRNQFNQRLAIWQAVFVWLMGRSKTRFAFALSATAHAATRADWGRSQYIVYEHHVRAKRRQYRGVTFLHRRIVRDR